LDLRDSEGDAEFRAGLRDWLEDHVPLEWRPPGFWARVPEAESFRLRREWEASKAEAGWSGVDWPTEYGGRGGTPTQKAIHDEEMGRVRAPASVNRPGVVFLAPTVMAIGTEEQKRRIIKATLHNEIIWCQGFSEPDAGSDLAALRTRATDDGDYWVLNGQKVWTSYGHRADRMFCLARTSSSAEKPHRGLTMLLFDMSLDGIEVRPIRQLSGSLDFCEVFFTDVRVPKASVLGEVGDGWNAAMLLLSFERSSAVEKYAELRPEHDDLVSKARTTYRDGTLAASDRLFRQRIGQLVIDLELLYLHALHVLTKVERGDVLGAESSVTKLQWSETHQDMGELFADLSGLGSMVGDPATALGISFAQQRYLWSRAETLYGGSSQVQRNIIAERLLNLPR
jgi:alkylation response protein AidB-like acyl-CoA dehydrogenase